MHVVSKLLEGFQGFVAAGFWAVHLTAMKCFSFFDSELKVCCRSDSLVSKHENLGFFVSGFPPSDHSGICQRTISVV